MHKLVIENWLLKVQELKRVPFSHRQELKGRLNDPRGAQGGAIQPQKDAQGQDERSETGTQENVIQPGAQGQDE